MKCHAMLPTQPSADLNVSAFSCVPSMFDSLEVKVLFTA